MADLIPDRASDAGPRSAKDDIDWRDYLYEAEDACILARRAEWSHGQIFRLRHIQDAMNALQKAKELLCR